MSQAISQQQIKPDEQARSCCGGGLLERNPISTATDQMTYSVPGMSCGHCRAAITTEVEKVAGVTAVDVDLDAKRVTVAGEELDDAAIRAAIDAAGYDVA